MKSFQGDAPEGAKIRESGASARVEAAKPTGSRPIAAAAEGWSAKVAVIATAVMAAACAAAPVTKAIAPDKANAVSLDPEAPNSYRAFAPELAATLARVPTLDPQTGLHVSEVKPNLFYVTDGVYQAVFIRTGDGIIVFDAPPTFAQKLPGVIAAHAAGEPVKFLLYSHAHRDHIGGSAAFAGTEGLKVVAATSVAGRVRRSARPRPLARIPAPALETGLRLGADRRLVVASSHAREGRSGRAAPQRRRCRLRRAVSRHPTHSPE